MSSLKIKNIRFASKVVLSIIDEIEKNISAGLNGKDLELIACKIMKKNRVRSSSFGYGGFPSFICVSVNSELTHGIPNYKQFEVGDIVSVDVACNYHGFHADAAKTFLVLEKNKLFERKFLKQREIISVTKECLSLAINSIIPGKTTNKDLGKVIQDHAKKMGYFSIREYGGHGVGRNLHEDPFIPNCLDVDVKEMVIEPGMVICIEPLIQAENNEIVTSENFVVYSKSGSLNAHFESTILILTNGVEILV
jgi:methionyl aminopeptidase